MSAGLLAATMMIAGAAATPPGNVEAIAPGNADLRPVGPEELRDFSIGEQPAEEQPAERPAQPQPQPMTQPATQPPAGQPAQSAPPRQQPAPVREAPQQTPRTSSPQPSGPAPSQPDGAQGTGSAPPPAPAQNIPLDPAPTSAPPLPGVAESEGISPWYWALALLLAGLAGFAFFRQRRAATAGEAPHVEPEAPARQPVPAAPRETPKPVEPVSPSEPVAPPPPPPAPASDTVGIKMAPELLLDLTPLRASLDENEFVIDYALQIANRGNGPARKLAVDTAMVMAGPEQEQKIAQFIAHPPDDTPVVIENLNSYGQIQMRSSLRIPTAQLTIIKMEDRQLILPTVVLYPKFTGGRGKPHRFVIGRKPKEGDKMAPMRADLGPRTWRDLEARKA